MELSNTKFEREYYQKGVRYVCGIDEVGMGCLAGPVVAAAVILDLANLPEGITDSKILSPKKREALDPKIREKAVCFSVAHAEVEEIDRLNIFHAAKLAMVRAVEKLSVKPDILLVDGKFPIPMSIQQKCLVKGDQLSVSIGAASIIAKVFRDKWMEEFDVKYPGYHFAKHKGYGSVEHRKNLQSLGASPIHRKSFSWTPV